MKQQNRRFSDRLADTRKVIDDFIAGEQNVEILDLLNQAEEAIAAAVLLIDKREHDEMVRLFGPRSA
jgi:hypothetical protein